MAIQPVMYLLARPGQMSPGKLAAQVAHAAVQAHRLEPQTSSDANVKRLWDLGGHYSKVFLQTDDLWTAERYIQDRGFQSVLIIDEGRTEFNADLTPTALGVEVLDKNDPHVAATFGQFKLYKEEPPQPTLCVIETDKLSAVQVKRIREMVSEGKDPELIRQQMQVMHKFTEPIKPAGSSPLWGRIFGRK